jgi:hypothetical protein
MTYPNTMAESSARLRACSHERRASSTSTVPPTLPSAPVWVAETHVLTTKLVLGSRGYGWPEEYALCRAFRRVVVETCAEDCAGAPIVLVRL